MTPTPKPPTRLTVSGGPKAQPVLVVRDEPAREPFMQAHPMTTWDRMRMAAGPWAASILIILVVVIFLVFGVDVR